MDTAASPCPSASIGVHSTQNGCFFGGGLSQKGAASSRKPCRSAPRLFVPGITSSCAWWIARGAPSRRGGFTTQTVSLRSPFVRSGGHFKLRWVDCARRAIPEGGCFTMQTVSLRSPFVRSGDHLKLRLVDCARRAIPEGGLHHERSLRAPVLHSPRPI